jgi:tartrate dehydrogenase/decarboxylase/D-malate dehydrogenase
MTTHRIAVLPGDGIGIEVVPPAQRILERTGELYGFSFSWSSFDWGCEYFKAQGQMMPSDGLEQLAECDEIFLGAVGTPGVPDHVSLWNLLIPIRRRFRQYINLRPIKLLRGIESPLRHVQAGGIDFLVVRENNEGEYSEIGGRLYRGTREELAVQESVFTRIGVERAMRYAFDLAQGRARTLTSATKSNGIIHTMPFWDEICAAVAGDYPDVAVSEYHIDALAALFVLKPERLDVVVASNLFGDILTDLGAALVGSIGIAPSANLNPEREHPSMFEPIHGSAPDIAGQGIANPIGQIWSGVMMLDHLGHEEAATALLAAIEDVLDDGETRTPDLGGKADTVAVSEAILGALDDHGPKASRHEGRSTR